MTSPNIFEPSGPISLKRSKTHGGERGTPRSSQKLSVHFFFSIKKERRRLSERAENSPIFEFSSYVDFRSTVSTIYMLSSY